MVLRIESLSQLPSLTTIDPHSVGDPNAPEKFQDPLYSCFGTGPDRDIAYRWLAWHRDPAGNLVSDDKLFRYNGKDFVGRVSVGYGYLSGVPNTPSARIKKIREKVTQYRTSHPAAPAKENASPGEPLEAYRYASLVGIEQMATSIRNKYGNARAVLEAMPGYSEEQARAVVAEIDKASGASASYATVRVATKSILPVALAVGRAVQQAIGIIQSDVSDKEKAYLGFQAAADLVALVPVYGTFVSAAMKTALSFWGGALEREKAEKEEYRRISGELITGVIKRTNDVGMPILFHALSPSTVYFSPASRIDAPANQYRGAFKGSPWQLPVYEALLHSEDVFMGRAKNEKGEVVGGLTSRQRDSIKEWWATAVMFMSDPAVYDVFDALGRDVLDGSVASDEQVMLVAAPIAASRGLDVDTFAKKLHAVSKGWRGETEGIVRSMNRDYTSRDWSIEDEIRRRDPLGKKSAYDVPFFDYEWKFCRDASNPPVQNAWWLNLAALTRDALALADDIEERRTLIARGTAQTASTSSSSLVLPAAAGIVLPAAAGIVAGLAFGGPIGVAVGIGALVVSRLFNSDKK